MVNTVKVKTTCDAYYVVKIDKFGCEGGEFAPRCSQTACGIQISTVSPLDPTVKGVLYIQGQCIADEIASNPVDPGVPTTPIAVSTNVAD